MTMQELTEYLDRKIQQNSEFIKITYYEARVKLSLSEEEIKQFLKLVKTRLENMNYEVYFANEKFTYQNMVVIVRQNELMIAVKKLQEIGKVNKKIEKQNVEKLLISNKAIEKLKENEIMNISQLCEKSKDELRKMGIGLRDVRDIKMSLQLAGLDLKNDKENYEIKKI